MQPQDPLQTPPVQTPEPVVSVTPLITDPAQQAQPIQQPAVVVSPAPAQPPAYNSKYFALSDIQDYKAVPLYRRRWVVIILTLLIVPVGAIIAWTGQGVYVQNQKTKVVYKFTNQQKIIFTLAGLLIILNNVIQLSHH